jgi:predicted acylesterase/phospholipase RssA
MFEAIAFAGGGNRCYWQGGFWEAAAPALALKPRLVTGVSGGAFAAAYSLIGMGREVRARVLDVCASGLRNLDLSALARGRSPFPVAGLYRALVAEVLDEAALAALNATTELAVSIARPPRFLPAGLAALAGLAAYQFEKHVFRPVHPRFGRALGFRAEFLSARAMPDAASFANAVYASACAPPFMPVARVDGRPALDGGFVDNVPADPLDAVEARGGRTLVLLTRRYPGLPVTARRTYVEPSQTIPVRQFDITDAEGIRFAHALGRRDGQDFARRMERVAALR